MNRTAFLFALLTVLFTGLFAADVMGYFNFASRPIAKLRAADGNVRRLAKDQMTWDRAQGGTLFGAGDTIATGEDSGAKLVFYAGGEVDLESGAMLVLGGEKGELKLNFVSGTGRVRVSKTSKTKISVAATGAGKTQRKAAEVEVADLPDEPEEEEAPEKGKVVAKAPPLPPPPKPSMPSVIQEKSIRNPQKTLSAQGELVSLASLPPTPKLTFPETDSIVRLNGSTVAKLQWMVPEGKKESTTDKRETFTYEVVLKPLQGTGAEKLLRSDKPSLPIDDLARGKYLWSVRAVNAEGKRGPASEFRGLEIKIPEHISKPVILPVRVE